MRKMTATALGLGCVLSAIWLHESFRVGVPLESEQELVAATEALMRETWTRPAHVRTPTDDSLVQEKVNLDAIYAATKPLRRLPTDDARRASDVLAGTLPLAEMPSVWLQQLDKVRVPLTRVVRASRGNSQTLPEGLRFVDSLPGNDHFDAPFYLIVNLVVLMGWQELAAGRPSEATVLCADFIAVGRDIAHPHLLGQIVGGMAVSRVFAMCTAAVDQSDAKTLEELSWSLQRIESGWTSFATTLHNESVFGQLVDSWEALPEGIRQVMPAKVRDGCQTASPYMPRHGPVLAALIGLWARRETARAMDRLIAAASKPLEEQDAAFRAHPQHLRVSRWLWNDSASNWLKMARRFRTLKAQRLLLRAGATLRAQRLRNGQWQIQLPSEWTNPRTELPLQLRVDPASDHATLVATPDSTREAPELTMTLLP